MSWLLSSSYYIQRALNPFADLRLRAGESPANASTHFIDQRVPNADSGRFGTSPGRPMIVWPNGSKTAGCWFRFAGPRLLHSDDDLDPVDTRQGGRILGGRFFGLDNRSLSPHFQRRKPIFDGMPDRSRYGQSAGLTEPDATLTTTPGPRSRPARRSSPRARRGQGQSSCLSMSPRTRWSVFPLSGTFVEMLKRIVDLAAEIEMSPEATDGRAEHSASGHAANPCARRLRHVRCTARRLRGRASGLSGSAHCRSSQAFPVSRKDFFSVDALAPAAHLLRHWISRRFAGAEHRDLSHGRDRRICADRLFSLPHSR